MSNQIYHLPIDWRRAKFYLLHPTMLPIGMPATGIDGPETCFVPVDRLDDLLAIRDWLYAVDLRYRLFGCYTALPNRFKGLMFVFEQVCDQWQFYHHWQHC